MTDVTNVKAEVLDSEGEKSRDEKVIVFLDSDSVVTASPTEDIAVSKPVVAMNVSEEIVSSIETIAVTDPIIEVGNALAVVAKDVGCWMLDVEESISEALFGGDTVSPLTEAVGAKEPENKVSKFEADGGVRAAVAFFEKVIEQESIDKESDDEGADAKESKPSLSPRT